MALVSGHGTNLAFECIRNLNQSVFESIALNPIEGLNEILKQVPTTGGGVGVVWVTVTDPNSDGVIVVHECGNVKCRVRIGKDLVYESISKSTPENFDEHEIPCMTSEQTSIPIAKYSGSMVELNHIDTVVGTYRIDDQTIILPSHQFLGHDEIGGRPLYNTTSIPFTFPELISIVLTNDHIEHVVDVVEPYLDTTATILVDMCTHVSDRLSLEKTFACIMFQTKHSHWVYQSLCIPSLPYPYPSVGEIHDMLQHTLGSDVFRVESFTHPKGNISIFIHFNPSIPSSTNGKLHYTMCCLYKTQVMKFNFKSQGYYWLIVKNTSPDNLRPVTTGIISEAEYFGWDGISDYFIPVN
jgi:hypothetical protein